MVKIVEYDYKHVVIHEVTPKDLWVFKFWNLQMRSWIESQTHLNS